MVMSAAQRAAWTKEREIERRIAEGICVVDDCSNLAVDEPMVTVCQTHLAELNLQFKKREAKVHERRVLIAFHAALSSSDDRLEIAEAIVSALESEGEFDD